MPRSSRGQKAPKYKPISAIWTGGKNKRLGMKFMLILLLVYLIRPHLAQAEVAPGECGTIVIPTGIGVSSSSDITSLNPLLTNSIYNTEISSLMYLGLFWVDSDTDQIDWSRSIASTITSPDDGTTYNVTLRSWHWSDGVPITTADIAYTFKLIKELGTSYPGYGAGGMPDIVKSLNILSPTQFQVVLKRRVNADWYIFNGLGQFEPLPAHSWGKYSVDQLWQLQSMPIFFNVVDGPMFAQTLNTGMDAVMVPNPTYQGPKLHFNRLVLRFLDSDGAELQGIEAGALDMANSPPDLWNAVQHLPGVSIITLPPPLGFNEAQLNFRNPAVAFFRDVRVRQAIADAVNQRAQVQLLGHGYGTVILSPVPPASTTFLSPEMKVGQYPVGYDPAKARSLLKQAGYALGPDGIMQKDGKKLSFDYLFSSGDADIEQQAELMQQDLAKIGIQMKAHEIEFNQLLAKLNNPNSDWQAAKLGESIGSYPSGEELFGTGASSNSGGYSDPLMDKYIRESTDEPGLSGLYAYENYASAQQPVIFMETNIQSMLVSHRILGANKFIDSSGQYYPDALSCRG